MPSELALWRAAAVVATVAALALVPLRTEVMPPVEVIVRDPADAPVFAAQVRVVWAYRLAGAPSREISTLTDSSGILRFPAAVVHASAFTRLRAILAAMLHPEPHRTYGPTATITAWAPGYRTAALFGDALDAGSVVLTLPPDPTWECPTFVAGTYGATEGPAEASAAGAERVSP